MSLSVIARDPIDKEATSRAGKTRDISDCGVYFTIDNNFNVGADLDLTIILRAEVTGSTGLVIKATGRVVRVDKRSENGDQSVGVAAVFEMPEIVRSKVGIA